MWIQIPSGFRMPARQSELPSQGCGGKCSQYHKQSATGWAAEIKAVCHGSCGTHQTSYELVRSVSNVSSLYWALQEQTGREFVRLEMLLHHLQSRVSASLPLPANAARGPHCSSLSRWSSNASRGFCWIELATSLFVPELSLVTNVATRSYGQ